MRNYNYLATINPRHPRPPLGAPTKRAARELLKWRKPKWDGGELTLTDGTGYQIQQAGNCQVLRRVNPPRIRKPNREPFDKNRQRQWIAEQQRRNPGMAVKGSYLQS